MRLLLDTHVVIWWLLDDPQISMAAETAVADPGNSVFVSSASAWEIATKHRIGKLPEVAQLVPAFSALLRRVRFQELAVTVEHALSAGSLPGPHKDPFDRLLIAQAAIEAMPLVTNEKAFSAYPIETIW